MSPSIDLSPTLSCLTQLEQDKNREWFEQPRGDFGNTSAHFEASRGLTIIRKKRVDVTALYDAQNYRPKVRDMLGKPMFLY
jgi:hypothetical protein